MKKGKKSSNKRREAKKSKKAQKRKIQLRKKALLKNQTASPLEANPARKLSAVIFDYAEPLMTMMEGAGTVAEENTVRMTIIYWNASMFSKSRALETLESPLDELTKGDLKYKSELLDMFDMMYDRKQNYFASDRRLIADYSLERRNGELYLQVASTPIAHE